MKHSQIELSTVTALPLSSHADRIADLAALRSMAAYLCEELLRLESDLFWSVALLPEAIDREVAAERKAWAEKAKRKVLLS